MGSCSEGHASIACLGKHSVDIFVLITCACFRPTWSNACMARCGCTAQRRHILKADMWYSISFLPCLLLISSNGWHHKTHVVSWCCLLWQRSRWFDGASASGLHTLQSSTWCVSWYFFIEIKCPRKFHQPYLRENIEGIRKCQNVNECCSASWHLGDYKWIMSE